jgi:RNA polymerase sigma-70 factor (ECF subfamily)
VQAQADSSDPTWSTDEFERFHRRTAGGLWRYLYRTTGDAAVADDVHQESYLRVLTRPGRAGSQQERQAYLYRIATNLCRDRWRRKIRHRRLAPEPAPDVPSPGGSWAARLDIQSTLKELKPRERSLLWLAYVEGYGHREIAEILDLKEGSVRVLLFRAKKNLVRILEKREERPS